MSQVQEVKLANDIVQIIGERVTLNRSGTNWRGLCPFHSEKSPSFFVSEQLQRYKCFGCNESGDVLTFLQKYDGLTFAEALQTLAERAGIELQHQHFTPEDDQRQRVLTLLDLTRAYYHYLLVEHKVGAVAREYLKKRGVTQDSIKLFQIGYALPAWDGLITYLHGKKKYSLEDLAAAGVAVQGRGGRTYDRFRDRIMFPLTDHRGRTVGFSGRVLIPETKEAKYVNTSETIVYHKSQLLFGYSQLYQSLRKENEVVVVEGEFDVISSVQAHVNQVVAVKGSVLTEDHMRLLSRTVQKVILSFDMDQAGVAATRRALEVARPFELELRVIQLPAEAASKDPDELARTQPKLWRDAVKSAISIYDFLMIAAAKQFDPHTPEGKRQIIDQLAPIFGFISHAVERDFYTHKLADLLEVKVGVVEADLLQFRERGKRGATTVTKARPESKPTAEHTPPTRLSQVEQYLLFLLFNFPEKHVIAQAQALGELPWQRVGVTQIVKLLRDWPGIYQSAAFARSLPDDLQQILFEVSLNNEYLTLLPELDLKKEWKKTLTELKQLQMAAQIEELNQQLEALERKMPKTVEDEASQAELLRKIVRLRQQKLPA